MQTLQWLKQKVVLSNTSTNLKLLQTMKQDLAMTWSSKATNLLGGDERAAKIASEITPNLQSVWLAINEVTFLFIAVQMLVDAFGLGDLLCMIANRPFIWLAMTLLTANRSWLNDRNAVPLDAVLGGLVWVVRRDLLASIGSGVLAANIYLTISMGIAWCEAGAIERQKFMATATSSAPTQEKKNN